MRKNSKILVFWLVSSNSAYLSPLFKIIYIKPGSFYAMTDKTLQENAQFLNFKLLMKQCGHLTMR